MFEIIEKNITKMTYDEYAAIDDGFLYELINGELRKMSPAPSFSHQRTNLNFGTLLNNFINDTSLGWTSVSPTDVKLDKYNTVQPDILFISKSNRYKINSNGVVIGAPDLVVEVISPSSANYDRKIKKDLYEKFGVKEYWLVDIDEITVEVFENLDGKFVLFSYAVEKGKLISKVLPGFEVDITDVMPDL